MLHRCKYVANSIATMWVGDDDDDYDYDGDDDDDDDTL